MREMKQGGCRDLGNQEGWRRISTCSILSLLSRADPRRWITTKKWLWSLQERGRRCKTWWRRLSAISVLQKLMFRCDTQCSEKALSVWQLASVVMQECEDHIRPIHAKAKGEKLWQTGSGDSSRGKRRTVEGFGRWWEKINMCEECENTFAKKDFE